MYWFISCSIIERIVEVEYMLFYVLSKVNLLSDSG